jgi:phosphonate transport system substrate-binding protein
MRLYPFLLGLVLVTWLAGAAVCFAAQGQDDADARPVYRFGLISLNHPLVIYQQYIPFLDTVSQGKAWRLELCVERRYADVVRRLAEGSLDVALLAGVTYLQAKSVADIEVLAGVRGLEGKLEIRALIVARNTDSRIMSLDDLRGKKFAFGSEDSTASYHIPRDFLEKNGIPLAALGSWAHLPSHDAVARAVLRGEYDAGALGEPLVQRYLAQGLKVLGYTPYFPGFLIVARRAVPAEVRENLRTALLGLDMHTPEIAAASRQWSPVIQHGFGAVDARMYDTFQSLLRQHQPRVAP